MIFSDKESSPPKSSFVRIKRHPPRQRGVAEQRDVRDASHVVYGKKGGKEMRKKIVVMLCLLLPAMPVLSLAEEKKQPDPGVSAYEHAKENAEFKRAQALFNTKADEEIMAERLAAKRAVEAKKEEGEEMRKKMVVMLCLLLPAAMPVLSFAEERKQPDPSISVLEQAEQNAEFKRAQNLLHKQEKAEKRAEKLAEKKAKKEAHAARRAAKAQEKARKKLEKNDPHPSASAYEHANENAQFKRTENLFYNKENTGARAERLAEKEAKREEQAEKKADESQDKGEGQVKMKF